MEYFLTSGHKFAPVSSKLLMSLVLKKKYSYFLFKVSPFDWENVKCQALHDKPYGK